MLALLAFTTVAGSAWAVNLPLNFANVHECTNINFHFHTQRAAFGFDLGVDWVVVLSVAWGVVTLLTVEGRALVAAALVVVVVFVAVFVAVVVAVAFGFVLGVDWVVVLSVAWGVVLGVGLEVGLVGALGGGFEAAEEGAFECSLFFDLEAEVVGAECGLAPIPEADADF